MIFSPASPIRISLPMEPSKFSKVLNTPVSEDEEAITILSPPCPSPVVRFAETPVDPVGVNVRYERRSSPRSSLIMEVPKSSAKKPPPLRVSPSPPAMMTSLPLPPSSSSAPPPPMIKSSPSKPSMTLSSLLPVIASSKTDPCTSSME